MNLNGNFAEQAMNCFHEINELYGGTINVVHHFIYSNNIISNECFTFKQAMKQEDKLPFFYATEKEVFDQEERCHWTVVHCKNLIKNENPIKGIWSFK